MKNHRTVLFAALLLAALPASAQSEASTLHQLVHRADAVVVATVLGASDPSPDFHRLQFRTDDVLAGTLGSEFALLEPAGRCCGRALWTLAPGQQRLLFLQRTGPTLHGLGGERGITVAEPRLLDHVRALLARRHDAPGTANLLAAALQHGDRRIRDDAILTLPALTATPDPVRATPALLAALADELPHASTLLPALLASTQRLQITEAAQLLVPACLTTPHADVAELARVTLIALPADPVFAALGQHWPDRDATRLRAAELLTGLDGPRAAPLLQRLVTETTTPRVCLAATEGLLRHGATPAALQARVPAAVLELAQRRLQTRPRFANVRP